MFTDHALADAVLRGVVLSAVGLVWVIGLTRLVGLRSFSKMTAFDFVATVATGSLLASLGRATSWPAFIQALVAMSSLFALQVAAAWGRRRSERFQRAIDNRPRILMYRGRILDEALDATRVARSDVVAKLREANARDPASVSAVVLEATGDISVLHGGEIDEVLLDDLWREADSRPRPFPPRRADPGRRR